MRTEEMIEHDYDKLACVPVRLYNDEMHVVIADIPQYDLARNLQDWLTENISLVVEFPSGECAVTLKTFNLWKKIYAK